MIFLAGMILFFFNKSKWNITNHENGSSCTRHAKRESPLRNYKVMSNVLQKFAQWKP